MPLVVAVALHRRRRRRQQQESGLSAGPETEIGNNNPLKVVDSVEPKREC